MHQAIAFRTAYLVVGTAEDAEEVAADALLKAVARARPLRAGKAVRPWLPAVPFFLELDEAETAAVLGVRRGTAKSQLSRALRTPSSGRRGTPR